MDDIKYFNVEAHGKDYFKIKENNANFDLYVFDHTKISSLKINEELNLNSGIYFINKRSDKNKLYIGQTSRGTNRFNNHNFIEKDFSNQYKIFWFNLNEDRVSKNILDYVERNIISEIGLDSLGNKNTGNISNLPGYDIQYSDNLIKTIKDYMILFDFDINKETNEEVFFDKETNSITIREKGDVINSICDFLSDGEWKTKKQIDTFMISKYELDLKMKRWASEYGLTQVVSRNLQEHSKIGKVFVESKERILTKEINNTRYFKLKS